MIICNDRKVPFTDIKNIVGLKKLEFLYFQYFPKCLMKIFLIDSIDLKNELDIEEIFMKKGDRLLF